MERHRSIAGRGGRAAIVLLAVAAGCGNDSSGGAGGVHDLARVQDLVAARADLTLPSEMDLAVTSQMDLLTTADLSQPPDLPEPTDLAMNADMTAPPDLCGCLPPDLTMPPDLATGSDLASAPDLTTPRDLASAPDLITPPDLPTLPDLIVPPDLAVVGPPVNVVEHHNHDSRDGVYVETAFTAMKAAGLTRDMTFKGTIAGNVYAQPLYIEGGPNGRAVVIAVTESNNVYALDAADGTVAWMKNVGTPVPLANLPCGIINPLGITGTPIVDLPTRTLYFDAMTTPDGGTTKQHKIFAMDVDSGNIPNGWPVDANAAASYMGLTFDSSHQNQRSALAIVGGILYVAYGGHFGDCNPYRGWLVGVPLANPAGVKSWATSAARGGSWAVGGPASDGVNPFIATGNTQGVNVWSGGEAIIRFQAGPVFSNMTVDYWVPANWVQLDLADLDIGGSGALLVDVPGATPSKLVVSLGKDGNAYLLDRTNLGGIGKQVVTKQVSSGAIIQAAATYKTAKGTYVVFRGAGVGCPGAAGDLTAFTISAANPPAISVVWCASENGRGSPFVTSTDGTTNAIVWGIGSEGGQRLRGFDGDTGAVLYAGGGANELMAGTRRFNTGIAARGRIFIANDNLVYAFK